MSGFNTEDGNTVSRDAAKATIIKMATDQGIKGAFKTFYDGKLIATPADLPEQVTISLIKVSAVLDQA